jgi:hypothetical protein
MNRPPQKGAKEQGSGSLGALEHRYGSSKKLAQEATQVALQKAANKKMLNPGLTMTKQQADQIVLDPVTMGMQQSQTTM